MSQLNAVLRLLADALLYPLRDLPPMVGVVLVSLVAAVFVLLVYRRTSNQTAIVAVKDQIFAAFFEIRLFNDDLRALLRAQGDLVRHNLRYLLLNLVPLLWMIVPFVLAIAQLQFHYGYAGLTPGRATVLTVDLAAPPVADAPRPNVDLEPPPGIVVATPGVWMPTRQQLAWRIAAERPGRFELQVRVNGEAFTKTIVASERIERRSPTRRAAAFLDQLLYPAEPPLPADGSVRSIDVAYPTAGVALLGLELHWLIWFLVLSIVLAYLLRKRFGVTF